MFFLNYILFILLILFVNVIVDFIVILFSVYSCLQCIAIIIFSQVPKYIVYFTLRMHTMRIVIVSA